MLSITPEKAAKPKLCDSWIESDHFLILLLGIPIKKGRYYIYVCSVYLMSNGHINSTKRNMRPKF